MGRGIPYGASQAPGRARAWPSVGHRNERGDRRAGLCSRRPHWYVDGVKAAEGKAFPSISWGTLTFYPPVVVNPGLQCENAAIGD